MLNVTMKGNAPMLADDAYPVLKKGNQTGMLVLFTAPKTGTILLGTDPDPRRTHQVKGYTSNLWVEGGFTTLPKGQEVVISNA